jgi:hypothetical protein
MTLVSQAETLGPGVGRAVAAWTYRVYLGCVVSLTVVACVDSANCEIVLVHHDLAIHGHENIDRDILVHLYL